MPNSHQHYVHRVGRTARAGRSGRSVSLVGESERRLLKEIVRVAKNPVKSRVIPAGKKCYCDRYLTLGHNVVPTCLCDWCVRSELLFAHYKNCVIKFTICRTRDLEIIKHSRVFNFNASFTSSGLLVVLYIDLR